MAEAKKLWLGFDLGGTKMCAHVFDDAFKVLGFQKRKTKAQEGKEATLQRIFQTIREALDNAGASPEQLAGIGMGCPGPVDHTCGVLLSAANMGWTNVPLKKILEAEFKCPAAVLNDVDAGVFGEYCFGAGKNAHCVLGVFPGTGIGGGCVYKGDIFTGAHRSVMEIGHLQMMVDGPQCGCGHRGCLEALASRMAIAVAAAAAAQRGTAPWLLKNAGTDVAAIRSNMLADSIKNGDRAVEDIIRQAARWIGVAVSNAVNLLGPDIVVLGGGLVEAMPTLFKSEVAEAAAARVMPPFVGTFKVVTAKLGDRATAQGAAGWARQQISSKS